LLTSDFKTAFLLFSSEKDCTFGKHSYHYPLLTLQVLTKNSLNVAKYEKVVKKELGRLEC
jgi:hypothetical protein